MTRLILMMTAAAVSLAACEDLGYYRGVGFSGLDGEPSSIAESDAQQGLVSRSVSSSEALAGLPPVRLQADTTSFDKLASTAISNGGRTYGNAVTVSHAGQEQMLSTVQVNSVLFAVVRLPAGNPGRMAEGAGPSFLAAVPSLTGCLAGGDVFTNGGSDNSTGLAVPLNCS